MQEGDIIQKGHITVSDKPGIGLTLNEEAMKKMVRPGSQWSRSVESKPARKATAS